MKVLIDHSLPFQLAHGGVQVQIQETKAALEALGVEVDWLRWWDSKQTADLIHFFSIPSVPYLRHAKLRKIPVLATVMLSEACNRPAWRWNLQGTLMNLLLRQPFGNGVKDQLNASAYRHCDHLVVGLDAEKKVLTRAFGVDPSRVSIVPLGLANAYLKAGSGTRREDYLICTGTITPVKRPLELALLAKQARVPILFVGKPYDEADPYWKKFASVIDGKFVKHVSHVAETGEMIRLYQGAKGFVLFSRYENWSLATSEAIACGLPVLLPNRNWSKERFGKEAHYLDGNGGANDVRQLEEFYRESESLRPPRVELCSWLNVAERLKKVYSGLLNTSR